MLVQMIACPLRMMRRSADKIVTVCASLSGTTIRRHRYEAFAPSLLPSLSHKKSKNESIARQKRLPATMLLSPRIPMALIRLLGVEAPEDFSAAVASPSSNGLDFLDSPASEPGDVKVGTILALRI